MAGNYEKAKVPVFDGDEENYDRWEIQWRAFAQVENLVNALGKGLDENLPATVADFNKTEKNGTTSKEQKAAVKANRQALAYLTLALKPMELLRLITRSVTKEWPEGEAWQVMQQLQEIYRPNDIQAIAEARHKLGALRMTADQNPSVLFCQLATLEHAYAHTSGKITDQDIIGTIFGIVPDRYLPTLNLVAENQGNSLKPSHLEAAMRKIWRQGGGSKGLATMTTNPKKQTEIVLTAFSGMCYVCKERGHRATHCPNKNKQGQSKASSETGNHNEKGKRFNGYCNHCGKQGHRQDDCWELPENAAKKPSYLQGQGEQGNVNMDCDAVEFVLCTIGTNKDKLAKKVTSMNDAQYCPSSLTQDEYNDLYGDVIVTEMVIAKVLEQNVEDEEKITYKVEEDNEKIMAHKVEEDNEKIMAHKVKEDDEKIMAHKVKEVGEENIAHKNGEENIAHKIDGKIGAHKIKAEEEQVSQEVKDKDKETNKNKIEQKIEIGLLNLKFPDKVQLLNDPNIWIGDTAATVHMTPYSIGMVKQVGNGSKQGITVGNGTQEETVMQGTIKGNLVNKNGVKMGVAMLTDVSYAPAMKFNLCSLSKLMVNGWKMEGDANSITMKKQGRALIFDIVVRTTTGLVFCMYLERATNEVAFSTITNRVPWSLLKAQVDEVDGGGLPPEVETTLIEADTGNDPEEQREEAEDDAVIDVEDDEDDEDDEPLGSALGSQWVTATTRAGRVSRLPARYRQEINAAALNSQAGRNHYALLIEEDEDDDEESELAYVEAGLSIGFENTNELHAINCKTAMKTPGKKKWEKAVEEEHDRMVKMNVWEDCKTAMKTPDKKKWGKTVKEDDRMVKMNVINNFSVGGRTRHMDTRQYYLRELKEKNIMVVKGKAGAENSSDMFTKKLPKKEFSKHAAVYVGRDEYMAQL